MAKMVRTTIMADGELLERLRAIARDEGMSLGEVIRQGLEWRASTKRRVPSFIGAIEAGPPHDTSSRVDELIGEYIDEKHAGY
jgi:hypothetical protein